MKNEEIYNLGKKLGLNKQDIESVLKSGITSCAIAVLPLVPHIYKDGTYYGTVSIKDF
jgi:hypothetical protein